MKKVEAIINPSELDVVKRGLNEIGIDDITILEVKKSSEQAGRRLVFRGTEFLDDLSTMLKIEVVVADELANPAIGVIVESVKATPDSGSKVFVSTVEQSFRMRTEDDARHAVHA